MAAGAMKKIYSPHHLVCLHRNEEAELLLFLNGHELMIKIHIS
jgi:hypothetical protein